MVTEAQKRATKKYQKEKYEFMKVRFKKGQTDKVRSKTQSESKSINQYCVDRILKE